MCEYVIHNTSFINNTADLQGGAIHYYDFWPTITHTQFIDNTAPYGHDIGSYASGYVIDGITDKHMTQVASGQSIAQTITVKLIDYDNQVVSIDSTSTIEL